MRIVAVADTHTFQSDLEPVPDGDVFVHAGDLLRGGGLDELAENIGWLRALPHRHTILVAGNHDRCFQDHRAEAQALLGDVIYLEDSGVTLDGLRFWGSPWQPAYHSWAFNLPRGGALADKWSRIPADTDVLITHGPPRGIGDSGPVQGRHGCDALLAAVERVRPAAHLFGHIHQDGGLWRRGGVCFANVTTWECERMPTVLDIDPETRAVTPISIPPVTG